METCKPTINIFGILKLRQEPYHNAMLTWLLDPDQSHGLDDAFLSRFLELVGGESYTIDDFQEIQAEYTLQAVRLDIFIKTRNHKIYIENKVFASSINDQQLEDQARCIRDHAVDKAIHVFIVPRQRDIGPSTQAVVDKHNIRTLTWSELVELLLKVLEVLVSKGDADRHVRAVLEQYLDYVKEHIVHMFEGFCVKEMQEYVEAAEVMWRFESLIKRQIEGFLTIVAEEVLSRLSGVVSSEWDFRIIKQDRSWAPVSWAVCFTSDEPYSDLAFCITIWYGSQADGLLRASVGMELYGERISQLAKRVYECAKALGAVQESKEDAGYYLWEEGVIQWSSLEQEQWQSFRDHLVERTVVWMTKLIPVIEERLQRSRKR